MIRKSPPKKPIAKKESPTQSPKDGDGRIVEYMDNSYQAEIYRGLSKCPRWIEIGPRVGDIRFAQQYIEDDRSLRERQREKELLEMKKNSVRKVIDY